MPLSSLGIHIISHSLRNTRISSSAQSLLLHNVPVHIVFSVFSSASTFEMSTRMIGNFLSMVLEYSTEECQNPKPSSTRADKDQEVNPVSMQSPNYSGLRNHCTGLCEGRGCSSSQTPALDIARGYPAINWEVLRRAIGNYQPTDKGVLFGASERGIELGVGYMAYVTVVHKNRILTCFWTVLPIDDNFLVRTSDREKPSSKQSHCCHMSNILESDVSDLLRKMNDPPEYESLNGAPNRYSQSVYRRCYLCPSEYFIIIQPAEKDEFVSEGGNNPFALVLHRFLDLGELQLEPSEEFRALTAAQVCCNCEGMDVAPPNSLYRKTNWSHIPRICDRFHVVYEKSDIVQGLT